MQNYREIAWFLPEATAGAAREFVRKRLPLCKRTSAARTGGYLVRTLYLDSADWRIYASVANDDEACVRLRVRSYGEDAEAPVYFEIKQRHRDLLSRYKFGLVRRAVPVVLAGALPEFEHFAPFCPKSFAACQQFVEWLQRLKAEPKFLTLFRREGFETEDRHIQVTFDRRFEWAPNSGGDLQASLAHPQGLTGDRVVLKLKYAGGFPDWHERLLESCDLDRPHQTEWDGRYVLCGHFQLNLPDLIDWIL